jgi:hypothetical protein
MKKETENKENSFLDAQKASSGMKVPKGYFENFEKEIHAKIQTEVKVIPIKSGITLKQMVSVLAIAAAFLTAFFWINTNQEITVESSLLAEQMIEVDTYDIDDYLLAENFTVEELDEIDLVEDYITDEEIYNYILEEGYSEYILTENL